MREELLQFSYEKLMYSADFQQIAHQFNIGEDMLEARRYFAARKPIRGIMLYLDSHDVQNGVLQLGDRQLILSEFSLSCEVFDAFSSSQITSAMVFLISCQPDMCQNRGTGELNYYFVENACIDLVRKMLLKNFRLMTEGEYGKKENIWFSDVFGPGYYNMPLGEGRKLHKLLRGERIGVTYQRDFMVPLKSSIGVVLSYQTEKPIVMNPCTYCQLTEKDCSLCGLH